MPRGLENLLEEGERVRIETAVRAERSRSGRAFPPINVFQQGDNLVAILELPGVKKDELEIQAKDSTIRISGKKTIAYEGGVSLHRRERHSGMFDRTLTVPIQSMRTASRQNTATAYSPFSSQGSRATSRAPSASIDAIAESYTEANMTAQELQVQEKREVEKKQETTIPARTFLPTTDIFETEEALTISDGNAGGR